jgi:hypothetical protein
MVRTFKPRALVGWSMEETRIAYRIFVWKSYVENISIIGELSYGGVDWTHFAFVNAAVSSGAAVIPQEILLHGV